MDWRNLFLNANGRIGRKDFWIGFAILFVAGLVLGFIPLLGQIIGLFLIYPQVCVFVKRLHDMGKSGWLYLAPILITVVLVGAMFVVGGAAMMSPNPDVAAGGNVALVGVIGLLLLIVNLGFLLWVGISKSEPGENRFGPPPGQLSSEVF